MLKLSSRPAPRLQRLRFSALQRAEIAEMVSGWMYARNPRPCFSALQRAEIAEMRAGFSVAFSEHVVSVLFNEPKLLKFVDPLRRAQHPHVSVLFNEPKLLKSCDNSIQKGTTLSFSALQRAEIAEIRIVARAGEHQRHVSVLFNEPKLLKFKIAGADTGRFAWFQCSSTSRNC